MVEWAKKSPKAIVIDGSFLRCHGTILKEQHEHMRSDLETSPSKSGLGEKS